MRINVNANNETKETSQKSTTADSSYKIIAVDDEIGIIDSLSVYLSRERL